MTMEDDETQPLLTTQASANANAVEAGGVPDFEPATGPASQLEIVYQPVIGHHVTCRICQAQINIGGKKDHHVVKCDACNEATPIRHPPPGKKYVRCPCNCLLICRSASQRILCPRPNCKRIINLSPPASPAQAVPAGMVRLACAHCGNSFLFFPIPRSLARCPHCRKLSAVGGGFRSRGYLCLAVGLLKLFLGIILLSTVLRTGGLIAGCVILIIIAILCLARAVYCFTMPISYTDMTPNV